MHGISTKCFEEFNKIKMQSVEQNKVLTFVHTEQVQISDLIEFYGKTSSFEGEKFFWRTPDKSFTMVGLGVTKQFQIEGNFKEVEEMLRNFSNGNNDVRAFGGFAFNRSSSETWKNFGNANIIVPRHLIVENVDGQFMTTVMEVNADTELSNIYTDQNTSSYKNSVQKISEVAATEWKDNVGNVIEDLKTTLIEKVVLARSLEITFENKVLPSNVLRKLDQMQSNCYLFSFERGIDCFIGASPEKLVSVEGEMAFAACLAGTISRGTTETESEKNALTLMNDTKNRSEHQYVVDFIADKFGKLCSDVRVPNYPEIMINKQVQHLYTPIEGVKDEGKTILDFVETLHPTPALGGTPTKEAVELIKELEAFERGLFAAPIGWLDSNGNGDFAVGIRSGLLSGNKAIIFAGAGIVEDSNVEEEYEETALKFKPMLNALCE